MHRLYAHQGFGLLHRGALLTKLRPRQSKLALNSLMEERQNSGKFRAVFSCLDAPKLTVLHSVLRMLVNFEPGHGCF